MSLRRTLRQVLRDKRGVATSIPEALTGVSLKMLGIAAVGGVLATGVTFWAVSSATADVSSGFQNVAVRFEKEVKTSDIIVGIDSTRVGILKDLEDGNCEVQTWQNGTYDGKTTLRIDTETVEGVCAPTTPLVAAATGDYGQELLVGIDTPEFTYTNLGGREITFTEAGAPVLATATEEAPEGVKQSDWEDTRPYKVELKLKTLEEDTAATTQEAVATGYTNVQNVTEASDALRYVPAPDEQPIPGPVAIVGVTRSTTTGTEVGGVREGIAVTFTGAVCPDGIPSKVTTTYTQQDPSAATPVSTVLNAVLTGSAQTVQLGSVPNGSSGAVKVSVSCVPDGVVVDAHVGYTQPIPATVLTATAVAGAKEKQDVAWTKVSSLPTSFELRWTVGDINNAVLYTGSALKYQSVNTKGANLGLTTKYTIVATVGTTKSPSGAASLKTPIDAAAKTTPTANASGATWTAITCEPYTTPQYATRYYQQTGTNTTVTWTTLSAWGTATKLTGVTTPAYGRTVFQVQTRCLADQTGQASAASSSANDPFYVPEALSVSAARSTTTGTAYQTYREGLAVTYTGGRCYNGTKSTIDVAWKPSNPSGQGTVSAATESKVLTTAAQTVHLANVKNGSVGSAQVQVSCASGKSSTGSGAVSYTQGLPAPVATVAQGSSDNRHIVSWNAVSSLTIDYTVNVTAAKTVAGAHKAKTTTGTSVEYILTSDGTASGTAGIAYGNKHTYTVTASVRNGSVADKTSSGKAITTAWPATPKTTVTSAEGGASWTAITCPSGTTAQYASHYYRQTGTDTTVTWSQLTAFGTARSFSGVATLAYGRTVTEAQTRCYSSLTGLASAAATSAADAHYKPEALTVSVARSTTTGTAYSGAREGALVTYGGGRCYNNSEAKLVLRWEPASPSSQSDVAVTVTEQRSAASGSANISNVRNGAKGNVVGTVECTAGQSASATVTKAYTQPVPAPVLTVTQGSTANRHALSWTDVSSLPASFTTSVTATKTVAGAHVAKTTTALSAEYLLTDDGTTSGTQGITYGNQHTYTVTATVNGLAQASAAKAITTPWPAAPYAMNSSYNGSTKRLTWSYSGSCPTDTTLYGRLVQNRIGLEDKSWSTSSYFATGYSVNPTGFTWSFSTGDFGMTAAQASRLNYQGWAYGAKIDSYCRSDLTGLQSATKAGQLTDFATNINKPAKPVFNGVRIAASKGGGDAVGTRPVSTVPSTCFYGNEMSKCATLSVDYTTYCPTGSSVTGSNFESRMQLSGQPTYNHAFGWDDYWLNETSGNVEVVYGNAKYACKAPWKTSAMSDAGNSYRMTVLRH